MALFLSMKERSLDVYLFDSVGRNSIWKASLKFMQV